MYRSLCTNSANIHDIHHRCWIWRCGFAMQTCQVCRCRSELVTGMRVCYQYICACKRGLSSMYGNYGIMRTPQRMCISPYSETTVWHIHRQNILRVNQVKRLIDAFMENMNTHSLGGSGRIKNVFTVYLWVNIRYVGRTSF